MRRLRPLGRPVLLLALFALLLLPPPADAQRTPQFTTRVDLVQFQVHVADESGEVVPGLGAEDFTLRVNGQERPVTTVYEVDVAQIPPSDAAMPPAAWRQWVLFLDAAFNTPRGVRVAQDAAIDFVQNRVQSGDLVGVATFSTVTGARLLVPPTRDRRQVLAAIGGLGLSTATRNVDRAGFLARTMAAGLEQEQAARDGDGAAGAVPDARPDIVQAVSEAIQQVNRLDFEQYVGVVAQYTGQLRTIADLLRTIRGRKQLVYFSQGFDDRVLSGQALDDLASTTEEMQDNAGLALATSSGEDRFGSSEVRAGLDETLAAFRSADTVVHVVDPSGVGGGRDSTSVRSMESRGGDFNARGSSHGALTAIADATGGEMVWDTNRVADALGDIEQMNRSYYVVAFPREAGDEGVLELELEVNRAGADVDAPDRLAVPVPYEEMSEAQRQIQVAEFVSKGIVASDLFFDVATAGLYGDGHLNRLPVVIEIPWHQLDELAESGGDDKVQLEIYSYALDGSGRMVDFSNGGVNLDVGSLRKSAAAGLPFRYYDLLWAEPGERRVRVILRDTELGRISASTSAKVTVPDHSSGSVVLSGPIAVDWEHPGLLMRGFDEDEAPPHKREGPMAYPFVIGDNEVTPAAVAAGPPGSSHHVYFVAHNLGRGPDGPQAMVAMALEAPDGSPIQLASQQMEARYYDEETDGTQMVAAAQLPPSLPPGPYRLRVMVNDQVKGERVSATMPLHVEGQ